MITAVINTTTAIISVACKLSWRATIGCRMTLAMLCLLLPQNQFALTGRAHANILSEVKSILQGA